MPKIREQFIVNKEGQKTAVVIPLDDYKRLLEDLHDLSIVMFRLVPRPKTARVTLWKLKNNGERDFMKSSTQRIEISLSDEDLTRINHLQTELHIKQKTALFRLALLKLEEAMNKEKEIARAIKGYAKFPESENERAPFLKLSLGTIDPENW